MTSETEKSTAKDRYDQDHPTRAFRSTPEIERMLEEISEQHDTSVSETIRNLLTEDRDAYDEGLRAGAEQFGSVIKFNCNRCGDPWAASFEEYPDFQDAIMVGRSLLEVRCPDCGESITFNRVGRKIMDLIQRLGGDGAGLH